MIGRRQKMALNADFETDFEVDQQSKATLRIHNEGGEVNRTKVTSHDIGSTGFSAKLRHVQYGTWRQAPAALLIFDFQFRFHNESSKRITSATIRFTFEQTDGPDLELPNPRKPRNDPQIVLYGPRQVCGEVNSATTKKHWIITIPFHIAIAGVNTGIDTEFGFEGEVERDHRMWLVGTTTSDDTHSEDNIMDWTIDENTSQQSGILHNFPGVIVIKLPEEPQLPVRLIGRVTPYVAFSLNPLRLIQKKDDAVYLDRVHGKGATLWPGKDFADPSNDWTDIVKIPSEYTQETVGWFWLRYPSKSSRISHKV